MGVCALTFDEERALEANFGKFSMGFVWECKD